MPDRDYYFRRASQSLDRAARTGEPMRGIHLELARLYTASWQQACEGRQPPPVRDPV